jgi:hypothetical protein
MIVKIRLDINYTNSKGTRERERERESCPAIYTVKVSDAVNIPLDKFFMNYRIFRKTNYVNI